MEKYLLHILIVNIAGVFAWSKEDTETLNGIVNYLFTSTDVSSIEGSDKWYDWLKSLKNRVIPKQEWSEEDDNCLSTIIAEFSKCAGKSVSKDEWMRCNDFLNSIRDRVQLPPKQKWSEVAVKCREAAEYDKKYMEE